MPSPPALPRRMLFSLAGASLFAQPAPLRLGRPLAVGGPATGTILATPAHGIRPALNVAGPREGELAALARILAGPLAAGLMEGGQLDVHYGGGIDGVTGADQFDARAAPDGREALLFPGSVLLDGLAGSRPVRFDCARMLPLLAACTAGVLMVRGALPAPGATGPGLRVAGQRGDEGALVAVLGLHLLGIPARRVMGPQAADAVFVHGPQVRARLPGLVRAGYSPALSTSEATASLAPAPFFLTALPGARLAGDELVPAWRALAAAADLCAALVLPRLSPAPAIIRWHRAAATSLGDEGVADQARRQSLRLLVGRDAGTALARMHIAGTAQMALGRWLSGRADFRPA